MKFVFCQNNLIFFFSFHGINLNLLGFSKYCLFSFCFCFLFWALSVISHHSIFLNLLLVAGPQNTRGSGCGSSKYSRGQAAGRVGRSGNLVGEVTEGSTHIVVFFYLWHFYRELCSRGPRNSFCFVSFLFCVFTASIGKSFGSGEQCQNWRESPKASGSTNSYDDVTWWAFL